MAKRFLPVAAVALVACVLAACTNPVAPAAAPSVHHVVPQASAGTLVGSDT